jgi:hypothetical protein
VQINLRGEDTTGNELMHVFGAAVAVGPVTLTDTDAIAGIVANWASTAGGILELIPTTFNILDVVCTARDVIEGPQTTLPIGVPGTRAGDPAPGSITLALKKAGVVAARWARGRFFAWPPTVDDYAENLFTSGYVSDALGAYNNLLGELDGGGYPLVVLSNSHAQIAPVSVIVAVDTLVDCQRRRLQGRGA